MSVLVVFLSWPSLLWLCWSLSYSVYSATVGPFGICAGLVLLGEPDQSWPDVDHIWMCSTYMLKPLCPFFCHGYANLYANTAGQHSPVSPWKNEMPACTVKPREYKPLCEYRREKKYHWALKGHWRLRLAQHIAMNHRTRYMFSLVCAEQPRACGETGNLPFSLMTVPPVIRFLLPSAEIILHNCKKQATHLRHDIIGAPRVVSPQFGSQSACST